jgi:hypothetical protein
MRLSDCQWPRIKRAGPTLHFNRIAWENPFPRMGIS